MAGQVRKDALLPKTVVMDGRMEWPLVLRDNCVEEVEVPKV